MVSSLDFVPVRLHAATNSTQDHITAWMIWNPVCDVIDSITTINPVTLSFTVMAIDLVEPEQPMFWLFVVVLLRRFGECIAAELCERKASCQSSSNSYSQSTRIDS